MPTKPRPGPRRSYGTGQSDRRGERSAPRDFSRSPGAIRSAGSELLVDVVFRFQALQQWLKKRLRRVRCRADRHRHFLGSRRKITRVRRNSRERQVADPVIRIFLWHLGKQLKSTLGVPRALQAAGVRVQLNRTGFIKALGKRFGGFFFSAHGIEDARFGFQIFKSLFILNRSVFPFQRFFQVVIVVQAPLRGLVVTSPGESADTPKLVFDAAQNNCLYVHGYVDGNCELLPPQSCRRRIRLDFLEGVGQRLTEIRGLWLGVHAQRVFFLVVAEAAPGSRVLRKNDRPLILVSDGLQPIRAPRKGFPFHGDIVGESDGGILIRAGSPYFSIRHRLAPNLPPTHFWPVIRNRDVRQSNALRHSTALADARNVQLRGLASVFELRAGIPGQSAESRQQSQSTLPHVAHNHTISSPKETLRQSCRTRAGLTPQSR